MNRPAIRNPLELAPDVADVLIPFIADVIELAHEAAPAKWGLTDYEPDIRINVAWTEILTTSAETLRLIVVDATKTLPATLGAKTTIQRSREGKAGTAYYPSIPGSVCVELPYRPLRDLRIALKRVRPALVEAISKSGRRGLGRSVRAGHSPDLVREIGRFVGRSLPQPQHASSDSTLRGTERAALMEGALRRVTANRFERNAAARKRCIAHYGARCEACKFSFGEAFGEVGEGFIHVHHVSPVANARERYTIDPVKDLQPVCPNCHAMLHIQDPPLSIKELRALRMVNRGRGAELAELSRHRGGAEQAHPRDAPKKARV